MTGIPLVFAFIATIVLMIISVALLNVLLVSLFV